jgi:uncharacterized membrane protein YcaP (DUF421 family)
MEEQIEVFDFHRIFLGDGPILFLAEIVFRTVIMYTYTILLLRFLGKRGMGQLSHLELAIIICFGSAVGDPMIGAQMPIVYGMVAITTVGLLQVGMERVINRHNKLESIVEGTPNLLVDDGIIQLETLKKENLSHADLFRALRTKDVRHLGEIDKAFFETSGEITVRFHPRERVRPGLTIMPRETLPSEAVVESHMRAPENGMYSCMLCGVGEKMREGEQMNKCAQCGGTKWMRNSIS